MGANRGWLRAVWSLLKVPLLAAVVIMLLVGGACLLVEPWRTPAAFANGLILAGAAVITFGFFSFYGGWQQTHGFHYQYGASAGPDGGPERARLAYGERSQGYRFMLQAAVAGLLPILLGALLQLATR